MRLHNALLMAFSILTISSFPAYSWPWGTYDSCLSNYAGNAHTKQGAQMLHWACGVKFNKKISKDCKILNLVRAGTEYETMDEDEFIRLFIEKSSIEHLQDMFGDELATKTTSQEYVNKHGPTDFNRLMGTLTDEKIYSSNKADYIPIYKKFLSKIDTECAKELKRDKSIANCYLANKGIKTAKNEYSLKLFMQDCL